MCTIYSIQIGTLLSDCLLIYRLLHSTGGIPYGSVSGMLAKYPGYGQINDQPQARQFDISSNTQRPVIITPNFRATRPTGISPRTVQIYNLPGVIAPGITGTISQIGY